MRERQTVPVVGLRVPVGGQAAGDRGQGFRGRDEKRGGGAIVVDPLRFRLRVRVCRGV
jgi:hypothetical protein